MRIVILTETFGKNMGYLTNMLPKYLARFGVEVHLVTLDLSPYHQIMGFNGTYSEFARTRVLTPGCIEGIDGYKLHVVPHKRLLGYMCMEGMAEKLASISPDIVYSCAAIGWIPLYAALFKMRFGYKLFTGSHTTASVFPLAQRKSGFFDRERIRSTVTRALPGRFVSLLTEKCYGATKDCAEIAVRFFGVQRSKMEMCPLGVDTELFTPALVEKDRQSRQLLREKFGFSPFEIVCIYTGRFSNEKNPLALAKAVALLVEKGKPFRALFVGQGVQADEIRVMPGCVVHHFVPVEELPNFYRASEIGVWPTQESTSMLDAAACGLPIVVNDTLIAVERIEGNGITYRLNDIDDLVCALLALADPETRKKLGEKGAIKMAQNFSWESLARRRLRDFEIALLKS